MIEDRNIRDTLQQMIMNDNVLQGLMKKDQVVTRLVDYLFIIYGALPNRFPDSWFKEALEDSMEQI